MPSKTGQGSLVFETVLESEPSAGASARQWLEGLAALISPLTLLDLRMVVTELVDNSVRHGTGGPIAVVVEVMPTGLTRGSVSDGGQGPVEIPLPAEDPGRGLGLRIVDALAAGWGVRTPSSDVWFELDPA
jgi:two-component sensor histidine kinase